PDLGMAPAGRRTWRRRGRARRRRVSGGRFGGTLIRWRRSCWWDSTRIRVVRSLCNMGVLRGRPPAGAGARVVVGRGRRAGGAGSPPPDGPARRVRAPGSGHGRDAPAGVVVGGRTPPGGGAARGVRPRQAGGTPPAPGAPPSAGWRARRPHDG